MNRLSRLDHLGSFKRDMLAALEQPYASPEQHRNKVDRNLVNETGLDELLRDVCAAHYCNIFISRYLFRFFKRGLNPINERVYTSIGGVFGYTMSNEDHWYPSGADWSVC